MKLRLSLLLLMLPALFGAQPAAPATGRIFGTVVDPASGRGIGYATVNLRDSSGNTLRSSAANADGVFSLDALPLGDYVIAYGSLGTETPATTSVRLDGAHRAVDLGRLSFTSGVVTLGQVQVTGRREAFENSIDRKVYNVGKDLQSVSGSASELLQNVPSVQVDVEGNVSLRGNSNVLVLIDGKTSSLMNAANRADVLQQMPADTIDKIEVITNPSAKYKPDGTAGIINISLKRQHQPGYSGILRASVGNDSRYNFTFTTNYRPGRTNLFGTFSVRQDDRMRFVDETRDHPDPVTGARLGTRQTTVEHMRPLSRLLQTGFDFDIDKNNKVGATVDYNLRTFHRTSTIRNISLDGSGAVTGDYDRLRVDPEWQKTTKLGATYQHVFGADGHELNLEAKRERHWEQEDNHYSNVYRLPVTPTSFDYGLTKPLELNTELTSDYTRPFAHDGKLETGYSHQIDHFDMDYRNGFFDPALQATVPDLTRTNRFIYEDTIDAFYATYGQPIGRFGFLAGLRMENTTVDTNQVTVHLVDHTTYFRIYPTLHLTYDLSDTGQVQLNYSHRIHRPDTEDLNPFPTYQDPYNLRAGNAHLKPEDTDSFEAGYQYRQNETTYLATAYFRNTRHGFTSVTRYIDAVTLLTTHENLATNRSGGLELGATRDLGPVSLNASANIYRNQIDASNLGFASSRSTMAWDAKLNANWHMTAATLVQFNTNYTAKRLTPQGEREPTTIANVGLRHDLKNRPVALVLTVSDLFDSLKERTVIDTPALHDDVTRRRSSRIVYLGFVYNFGAGKKKGKDNGLQFDTAL